MGIWEVFFNFCFLKGAADMKESGVRKEMIVWNGTPPYRKEHFHSCLARVMRSASDGWVEMKGAWHTNFTMVINQR